MLLSTPQMSRIHGLDGHSINLCVNGKVLERVSTLRLAALFQDATQLSLIYFIKYVHTLLQFPRKPYPIRDKMGKVYTRFKTKRPKNHTRWGGTYLHGLYKGVPPPPLRITVGPCGLVLSNSKVDKVSPLFSIKTINKSCRVASQEMRCSSD